MAAAFDVREFALELLERSKEYLRQNKTLAPVGFILKANGAMDVTYFDAPNNEEEGRRIESFLKTARDAEALAVITIRNSTSPELQNNERPVPAGRNGNDGADPRPKMPSNSFPSIIVTIDAADQTTTILKAPYILSESAEYAFEPVVEVAGDSGAHAPASSAPTKSSEDEGL
jgi:hypothetical protein